MAAPDVVVQVGGNNKQLTQEPHLNLRSNHCMSNIAINFQCARSIGAMSNVDVMNTLLRKHDYLAIAT